MRNCTCNFPGKCDGSGWLNCRDRAWGSCFCQCGCTEDCYGCEECLSREYDDDFDIKCPADHPTDIADGNYTCPECGREWTVAHENINLSQR